MLTRLWRKALEVLDRLERIDTIAAELGMLLEQTRHVCISCHDFLADDGGSEALRTKAFVRQFLVEQGFRVTRRDAAPEPWTRDYLYGVNAHAR